MHQKWYATNQWILDCNLLSLSHICCMREVKSRLVCNQTCATRSKLRSSPATQTVSFWLTSKASQWRQVWEQLKAGRCAATRECPSCHVRTQCLCLLEKGKHTGILCSIWRHQCLVSETRPAATASLIDSCISMNADARKAQLQTHQEITVWLLVCRWVSELGTAAARRGSCAWNICSNCNIHSFSRFKQEAC